jgi:putative CocE/NonD family hydrolase
MKAKIKLIYCAIFLLVLTGSSAIAQKLNPDSVYYRENYTKHEYMIPMRDGVKLFTAVYVPKDESLKYPFLMMRTPYGCAPYGKDNYPASRLGPSMELVKDGYIFVRQDVRGRYMSEGTFTWTAPNKENPKEWDESSDTYDTIDWLLKNVKSNNGKVGTYGGSYPGFYVTAGIMDAHPALKAAMPSAPMGDLWRGDDGVHNGAFLMPHNINFIANFGVKRQEPLQKYPAGKLKYDTPDGYKFWLDHGPLTNLDKKHFNGEIIHWEEYKKHPVYDEFWKSRNVEPHLKNIKPAVMTVGGWFDAQDIRGPFIVYNGIKNNSPKSNNRLILGPWYHGSWSTQVGDRSANIPWGSNTGEFYRKELEFKFFSFYLKDKGTMDIPNVMAFNTGANKWNSFEQWPPVDVEKREFYLNANGKLSENAPKKGDGFDEYISDPKKPVPYTQEITTRFGNDWMVEDQRFASTRPDVIVYESEPLTEDLTIAGAININLIASTSGTDADFIVKVIDVYPNDAKDPVPNPQNIKMGGYQMLLRGDPIRAKFRNSLEKPEPMVPNQPTALKYNLTDAYHTFKKGHKIMVQVQSTWFPMIDLNPGKFVDMFNDVKESDFQKINQKIYHDDERKSSITFGVYKK